IKKQKGTGTARAGSAKNPLFKGGGTVFGPRPRSYSFKLNKSLKRLARKSAFSIKAKESNIIVLEDFNFETPNTKNFINVLKALELENKKSLFVLGDVNKNVYLSSRNLKGSSVVSSLELSTYAILNANNLVLLESSLEIIEENLSK
ncbi:50S ribosomal protein L4, partial [Flavobacterium sp.]